MGMSSVELAYERGWRYFDLNYKIGDNPYNFEREQPEHISFCEGYVDASLSVEEE